MSTETAEKIAKIVADIKKGRVRDQFNFERTQLIRQIMQSAVAVDSTQVYYDLVDREKDRVHPEKRHRPIAAGLLSPGMAVGWLAVCWGLGAWFAYSVNQGFLTLALGYVALQVCY